MLTLQDRVRTLSRPVSSASGMSIRADSELDEFDEDGEGGDEECNGGLDGYDSDTTLKGDEDEEEGEKKKEEENIEEEKEEGEDKNEEGGDKKEGESAKLLHEILWLSKFIF